METHNHDHTQPESTDESSESISESQPPIGAPPTGWSGDAPRKRETVWPTVFAVLSFVWGGLSLIFSGCTTLMSPFYGLMVTMFEDAGLEKEAADMQRMADLWWMWLLQGAISAGLAILLIVAGVGLMKRTYRGVRLARIWSVVVILQLLILTPINVYLTEFHGTEAQEQTQEQVELIVAIAGAALVGLISLILPVLMLIWFGRARIKHEVSDWPR